MVNFQRKSGGQFERIFHITLLFTFLVFCVNVTIGQSSDKNYIIQTDLLIPELNPANIASPEDGERLKTIQYFDGIGRAIQINNYHRSPTANDLIQHIEYDVFGQKKFNYLPFPSQANGAFKSSGADLTLAYYSSPADNPIPADSYPYGEKLFDDSPCMSSKQFAQV
jgi:hypothetical protein